jgi:acyl-CoA thioesterase FadM
MSEPGLEVYRHRCEVVTRRSDSVGNGHIPNAVLAAYFDDAREGLHHAILARSVYADSAAFSLVLGEIGMRFSQGISFPGILTIGVGVKRIGRCSIDEAAGFFCDGHCLATAWCTLIKLADRAPAPFTDEERARAELYMVSA